MTNFHFVTMFSCCPNFGALKYHEVGININLGDDSSIEISSRKQLQIRDFHSASLG